MIVYQCILGIGPGIEHQLPGKFISHTLSISRCGELQTREPSLSCKGLLAINALLPSGHFMSSGMASRLRIRVLPPRVFLWFWEKRTPSQVT